MNIAILHGYGLRGSGSNLYVNKLSEFLCRTGQDVHVICQERLGPFPPHVTSVIDYDQHGRPGNIRQLGESPLPGKATVHRPTLGPVLPVYNWDSYPGFPTVKTFLDLAEQELDEYINLHTVAVATIVDTFDIHVIHANHVLAMPEVARRACQGRDCQFVVMPHGSAIEYVARKSERYRAFAKTALDASRAIVSGGPEMLTRLDDVWGDDTGYTQKTVIIPTGVDLSIFTPRAGKSTPPDVFGSNGNGASRRLMDNLFEQARTATDDSSLLETVEDGRKQYEHVTHDADLADNLTNLDWTRAEVVLFAGKLVAGKGVHALITAMSGVGKARPDSHLVIIGEGSFREPLELLLRSIAHGEKALFDRIVKIGWEFDHKPRQPLTHLEPFTNDATFEELHNNATTCDLSNRVTFAGFLDHSKLPELLSRASATVLPSVIPEAYPLALAESLAVGIPPIATDIGGAKTFFDELLPTLRPGHRNLRVRPEPSTLVSDLTDIISHNLRVLEEPDADAIRYAHDNYSWDSIAGKLIQLYENCVGAGITHHPS